MPPDHPSQQSIPIVQQQDPPIQQSIHPPNMQSALGAVIDLTSDDSPHSAPPSRLPSRSHSLRSPSHSPPALDDDVIFTGQHRPPVPSTSSSRLPEPAQGSSNSTEAPSGSRGTLTGRMAALTAGIYAGFFSSTPSHTQPAPAQGPSSITIRDSPPLQVRRSRPPSNTSRANSRISFGGGGRFSGGQFSGLLATSLSSLRGFASGRAYATSESLEEMLNNWSRGTPRRLADEGPSLLESTLQGNLLTLSPDSRFFAAIYDFDGTDAREAYTYKPTDSHPLKIMPGFSKEIVPLDREILTLDSDSASEGQMVKQELRPVCAACDRDLLMGQESSIDGSAGRRPWILACGHVVDASCLEHAKERAREAKRLHKTRKPPSSRATAGTARARGLRPAVPSSTAERMPFAGSKRRKLSTSQPTASSSRGSALDQSSLICAQRRKERAEAREARKSIDHLHTLSGLFGHPKPLSGLADGEPASELLQQSKGKGKAEVDSGAVVVVSQAMESGKPCEAVKTVEQQSWIQCPVKGCKGAKGDVLALVGSKKGPWEMFV